MRDSLTTLPAELLASIARQLCLAEATRLACCCAALQDLIASLIKSGTAACPAACPVWLSRMLERHPRLICHATLLDHSSALTNIIYRVAKRVRRSIPIVMPCPEPVWDDFCVSPSGDVSSEWCHFHYDSQREVRLVWEVAYALGTLSPKRLSGVQSMVVLYHPSNPSILSVRAEPSAVRNFAMTVGFRGSAQIGLKTKAYSSTHDAWHKLLPQAEQVCLALLDSELWKDELLTWAEPVLFSLLAKVELTA